MTKQILAGRKSRKMTMAVSVAALAIAAYAAPQTGVMTDSRDGKTYKTVKIGSQTWMAENLNYKVEKSVCNNDVEANCSKYGRLYDWTAAMTSCPVGWHLPSRNEFKVLFETVGGRDIAGKMLKSTSGWENDGNGTDAFGFTALPAGQKVGNGFYSDSSIASFWSSTEEDDRYAFEMHMGYSGDLGALGSSVYKDYLSSVRCLQDVVIKPQMGIMKDPRDGKKYKTVKIGTQTWMAENLNYKVKGSRCYNNIEDHCSWYGRLYKWERARNICPSGWHLPTKAEFETLFDAVGGQKMAGKMLKSTSGWENDGNGTDAFGFTALPAGMRSLDGYFFHGQGAFFWSSTEKSFKEACIMILRHEDGDLGILEYMDKFVPFSVRCLKD